MPTDPARSAGSCFTNHASRITHHVSRFTFHVSVSIRVHPWFGKFRTSIPSVPSVLSIRVWKFVPSFPDTPRGIPILLILLILSFGGLEFGLIREPVGCKSGGFQSSQIKANLTKSNQIKPEAPPLGAGEIGKETVKFSRRRVDSAPQPPNPKKGFHRQTDTPGTGAGCAAPEANRTCGWCFGRSRTVHP